MVKQMGKSANKRWNPGKEYTGILCTIFSFAAFCKFEFPNKKFFKKYTICLNAYDRSELNNYTFCGLLYIKQDVGFMEDSMVKSQNGQPQNLEMKWKQLCICKSGNYNSQHC